MRILVHDYSGHPFQVQLSRELARRGHVVLHLHCSSFLTGKGSVEQRDDEPDTFAVEAIDLGEPFQKYSARKRWPQERRYGRLCADRIERFGPDVVLSSNAPLFVQQILVARTRRMGARFVFWQQDVYSIAMQNIARRKLPVLGGLLGRAFVRMERTMLAKSDWVVPISEDFVPVLRRWGIDDDAIVVVENWAPLDELASTGTTGWADEHGLAGRTVLLYSGTLGLKHNPRVLLKLARRLGDRDDARVVVISEGLGAQWLRNQNEADPVPGLVLLPFQSYERLPEVMSNAAVLLAILEPEAGVFSVPSKVLSYHCAERPILAAIPRENLAARIIQRNGSGVVVDPGDDEAFIGAAMELLDDAERRCAMGARARAYAESAFDITTITERFERILTAARPSVARNHAPSTFRQPTGIT
jgi:glycosyltransferase involved in cell wall biosynthesis